MPQLDFTTYNIIGILLLVLFWTYFSVLYVAVSYTSQKLAAAFYFKFYIILVSLLLVYALEVENNDILKNSSCNDSINIGNKFI